MKNKTKKGFTLIELLAIIVILAIIAVITVPIILNIIDNSRKGAATDSAYGYKDSVNKYYIQELQTSNKLKLDGTYTVNSDGSLTPGNAQTNFGDDRESLDVSVSGTKPSSGTLIYSNNVLTEGCLVIGDYAVTFNGNSTSTVKGNCSSSSEQGSTQNKVAPVVYTATWNDDERTLTEKTVTSEESLAIGDYVKLGENDGFYVINPNRNEKVVLMSEYNTTSTWRQAYHEVATDGGTIILPDETYYTPTFSNDLYWEEKYDVRSDCSATYCPLYSDEGYAFIYDNNSNLYAPMENYKVYLENETGLELTVRPMSYSEATSIISNSWAYNQTYWLGSEYDVGGDNVWILISGGTLGNYGYLNDSDYDVGVRPVIEISISEFQHA